MNGVASVAARDDEPYDVIGLGFGPSNLAIAVAEGERDLTRRPLRMIHLDAQHSFSWHPGMMLDGSRMQVVFLKDLISIQNPRSQFTFLNYLHEHQRLNEFINLRSFYPTREEYNDYYHWVASHFSDVVRFRRAITAVRPILSGDGGVDVLEVTAENLDTGQKERYSARHVTVGLGGKPHVSDAVHIRDGSRAFHSSECAYRFQRGFPDRSTAYEFAIVGSGQTAADILFYLINAYPNARCTVYIRGFAFKPQDDTHFVNELFFPETTDLLYSLAPADRRALIARHRDVTHSAVDLDLLPLLYDAMYQDKFRATNRIAIRRFHELRGAEEGADFVRAVFRDSSRREDVTVTADALIMATGYDRRAPLSILREIDSYLIRDSDESYRVGRYYNVMTTAGFRPKVYLQGYCEETHGFSEVLLSLLPVRAAQILSDIWNNVDDNTKPVAVAHPVAAALA